MANEPDETDAKKIVGVYERPKNASGPNWTAIIVAIVLLIIIAAIFLRVLPHGVHH